MRHQATSKKTYDNCRKKYAQMARDEQKYEIQNDLIVERELHNELKPRSYTRPSHY